MTPQAELSGIGFMESMAFEDEDSVYDFEELCEVWEGEDEEE